MKTLARPKTALRRGARAPFGVRLSGMWIVTPEQATENLPELLHYIARRRNFVVIDRDGKPGAILARPDESWRATIEIMSDPGFMASVRRGVRQANEGRFLSERETEELLGRDRPPRARKPGKRR